MDLPTAAGASIKIKLQPIPGDPDGEVREMAFGRLKMNQCAELAGLYENDMGVRYAGIEDLIPYAGHPLGALSVIRMSLARLRDVKPWTDIPLSEAVALGSIKQRCDVARLLVSEALTCGEDAILAQEATRTQGKAQGSETGPTKPS